MKIIDIGICINNVDPKGIGRIRYKPYGLYSSEISHGIKYEEWDNNDPFVVLPFLPLHLNIIPQTQQSIKIIKYDTDKDTQNLEYVAGPFASPHDLENQTFASQHRDTTYGGVIIKDLKDIRNKNGKFFCEIYDNVFLHYRAGGNWLREGLHVHKMLTKQLKEALL